MAWNEQEMRGRKPLTVTPERAAVLDMARSEALPVVKKEVGTGDKSVEPIKFQSVLSPGIFEAEFGTRGDDIIFHFWPWGFHEAERLGKPRVAFTPGFGAALSQALVDVLDGLHVHVEEVRDMGSWYASATGYAKKQFWRELAIKAITRLHHDLGGE